ncbi:MAG: hypothetical protein ACJ70Z_04600, partial [Nitrososphaera sp.]
SHFFSTTSGSKYLPYLSKAQNRQSLYLIIVRRVQAVEAPRLLMSIFYTKASRLHDGASFNIGDNKTIIIQER